MKVITIKQPFASLIASGQKEYEFRTWKTSYRGDILIHAQDDGLNANGYTGTAFGGGMGCGALCGALAGGVAVLGYVAVDGRAHATEGFRDLCFHGRK